MSSQFSFSFIYLKALEFIHDLNIAHRVSTALYLSFILRYSMTLPLRFLQDAFYDNFVIQWHPESLRTMKVSICHPRVYLIDFETAVQFPAECPLSERVSVGHPFGEKYSRPHAPEFASGNPYNPFKLDVWQLGYYFSYFNFKVWQLF
jgi:serine/threonine protein kinase